MNNKSMWELFQDQLYNEPEEWVITNFEDYCRWYQTNNLTKQDYDRKR